MNKFDKNFQDTDFVILKGNNNGVGQTYFNCMQSKGA